MSQRPQTRRPKIKVHFRKNFEWWERAYVVDWIVVLLIWILGAIVKSTPTYERDFGRIDPLINHRYRKEERVPSPLLHILAFWLPLLIALLAGGLKGSSQDLHHAVLSLCTSIVLSNVITQFLKHRIGRLRPDFLSRCNWDAILSTCTGIKTIVMDGRRSFPSGHSSMSFAGLGVIFFLLAGQFGSLCLGAPSRSRSFLGSKILRFSVTLSPILLASWIAITRLEDYRHHTEDVLIGSLLGLTTAFIGYIIYWPNPFRSSLYLTGEMSQPKILYRADLTRVEYTAAEQFELSAIEEEQEPLQRSAGEAPVPTSSDVVHQNGPVGQREVEQV